MDDMKSMSTGLAVKSLDPVLKSPELIDNAKFITNNFWRLPDTYLTDAVINIASSLFGLLPQSRGPFGMDDMKSKSTGLSSQLNYVSGTFGKKSNAANKEEHKPLDPVGYNSLRDVNDRAQDEAPPFTLSNRTILLLMGQFAYQMSIPVDRLRVKLAHVKTAVTTLVSEFKLPDFLAFAKGFTSNWGCERFIPNIIPKATFKIEKCVQYMADVVNFKTCPPSAGEEENQEEEAVDIKEDPTDVNEAAKTWHDVPQFSYMKSMLNLGKKFLDRVDCEKPTTRSALMKGKILCEETLVDAINNYACT
ncbi:uncharacterized protein LOC131931889 [Physella acuta]|uniref:uncharacterized protein LOC131931889 n=1 Tax=Physella acuta TaxID=109671 RepID=UPI0027DC355D|nr:uncharacterized protein LOC131931889 [Physella acuta]